MSQIQMHCRTNNARLGFKPGNPGAEPMGFEPHKRSDRQADMITLRHLQAELAAFNTGELLEAAVIDFNLPGIQGMESGHFDRHL